ncbi:MAG: CopG family transcriptional regulator [Oscillospiraceae bacterium]|nr:CopG family transcriptional regulator [Oscillospiraceae bacterium]
MNKFLPKKPEKEVISMRIPTDTLEKLDKKAAAFEISRNEFINQCITFALANMDDTSKK